LYTPRTPTSAVQSCTLHTHKPRWYCLQQETVKEKRREGVRKEKQSRKKRGKRSAHTCGKFLYHDRMVSVVDLQEKRHFFMQNKQCSVVDNVLVDDRELGTYLELLHHVFLYL
jgi:hypothetical protein